VQVTSGRAPADRTAPRKRRQLPEALLEDRLFLLWLKPGDALVLVAVAADLVPRRRDGADGVGVVRGDPRKDEEGRADFALLEQRQDARQASTRPKRPCDSVTG